jgi:inward rectifier potassium channel
MQQQIIDPGTGEKYFGQTKRLINKDGSFNVVKTGADLNTKDLYHFLITISWTKFFLLVVLAYIVLNIFFSLLYFLMGAGSLIATRGVSQNIYLKLMVFSFQTFTTVGYGNIYPDGVGVDIIAAFEALTGLMSFALFTGLLYGRFSKPTPKILYSQKAIVAPYQGINALQFRVANQRKNNVIELEARVLAALTEENFKKKYYELKLERYSVTFFPLSWTVVHPMDEDSPLSQFPLDELEKRQLEVMILMKGFDETFSQVVYSTHSYTFDEIVWGAKFQNAFATTPKGDVVLNLKNLHLFDELEKQEAEKNI